MTKLYFHQEPRAPLIYPSCCFRQRSSFCEELSRCDERFRIGFSGPASEEATSDLGRSFEPRFAAGTGPGPGPAWSLGRHSVAKVAAKRVVSKASCANRN